jgi:hypothetical protein
VCQREKRLNELQQAGAWSAQTAFAPEPSGVLRLELRAELRQLLWLK